MADTTWPYDTLWYNWTAGTAVTNTSATNSLVWQNWTAGTNNSAQTTWQSMPSQETLSARRRAERDFEERRRKSREAMERAKELLLEHLDEEQRDRFERHKRFRVRGSHGGVYDICHQTVQRIEEVGERDRVLGTYCIHAGGYVPEPDNMLAKKLMIEADEERFLAIANYSRY